MHSKSEKLDFFAIFPISTERIKAKLTELESESERFLWKFIITTSPLQLNHSAVGGLCGPRLEMFHGQVQRGNDIEMLI